MNNLPRYLSISIGLMTGLAFSGLASAAKTPSLEQMWKMIQAQQKEIRSLKQRNRQLSRQVDATGNKVRVMVSSPGSQAAKKVATSKPVAASGGHHSGSGKKTTIGGYGELHYNNLDSKKEIDFHRFVLFFGHKFNDRLRFFSELEVEHAFSGEGKPGEVELEQAYIEYDLTDRHRFRAGVFLVPVGLINLTHEPDTFYGTERNPVEKNIVPATWWEAGAGLSGQLGEKGWSYDLAIHSGLKISSAKSYAVRSGRQKAAKANANDLAATGRIRWTGMPGLEIGATINYQSNMAQGTDSSVGSGRLFEVHIAWQRGPFSLRALYARWDIDGSGPAAVGADKQEGWYVEPSWKITPKFGIFARYNEWDNKAGNSANTNNKQTNVGFNYWLHPNVVFKFDIQKQDGAASDDGFNLGVGYQF